MKKIINTLNSTADTAVCIFEVTNRMGIHARPAAMIVRIANKYNETELWVEKANEQVNGKSIMGLMMLAAGYGTQLKFIAKGVSAQKLLNEIKDRFDQKFEEA